MKAVLLTVHRLFKHIEQEGAKGVKFCVFDAAFFQDRKDSVARVIDRLEFHSGIIEDHFVQGLSFL